MKLGVWFRLHLLCGRLEMAKVSVLNPPDTENVIGSGLLGFSPKPLGRGDTAYLNAIGLTHEQIKQVVDDLRDGMSPLTRRAR
jgi:hypothetical protein